VAENKNYLLAKGHLLTSDVEVRAGGGPKKHVYTLEQTISRLNPMLKATSEAIDALPESACSNGEAVAAVTLHPQYIAKSYFPVALFNSLGLRGIGSKEVTITPVAHTFKKTKDKSLPTMFPTSQIYIAGSKHKYRQWLNTLGEIGGKAQEEQFRGIEKIHYIEPKSKIQEITDKNSLITLEIVLHDPENLEGCTVLQNFLSYLEPLNLMPDLKKCFHHGRLCFLRMEAPKTQIQDISQFSFVRVIRQMPKIKINSTNIRSIEDLSENIKLPEQGPLDPNIKVAIFDGGIPRDSCLAPWVKLKEPINLGPPKKEYLEHGMACTSALLFGSLDGNKKAPRPYANVDHFRVLDKESAKQPRELYDALDRIKDILLSTQYDFISLNIGPDLPIQDGEVSAWTAVLDEYIFENAALATIAVGNNGEYDPILKLNRIQAPSDCVNALSVGACDSQGDTWKRAAYSAVGPGRSPGVIKPDVVGFGGTDSNPFLALSTSRKPLITGFKGTSFAAPEVLRMGIALRAYLGGDITPLVAKALLIHTSEKFGTGEPNSETGWGRVARSLDDIIVCKENAVCIIYSGRLDSAKYLRAIIPSPKEGFVGKSTITATFCYLTTTDPAHPATYTRSGLEITFRPHSERFKKIKSGETRPEHAETKPFFGKNDIKLTEFDLRKDSHKWETCLHSNISKMHHTLKDPVFDIHYLSRFGGQPDNGHHKIKYALVITIDSPETVDLGSKIRRRFPDLETLMPIHVPLFRV